MSALGSGTSRSNKLISAIANRCLSSLKSLWPRVTDGSGAGMDSAFIKCPSAPCTVWFLWPQPVWGLLAGFSLTRLWPGFRFPPEAASSTVIGVDKQVDSGSYSCAWSYHKPEGGRIGEKDTPELKLTDRKHWPSYTGVTQMNVVFFPLRLVWLTSERWKTRTEYSILLCYRSVLQKPAVDGVWRDTANELCFLQTFFMHGDMEISPSLLNRKSRVQQLHYWW